MTLADELMGPHVFHRAGRRVNLEDPPLRLAFNGELSNDERRLLYQGVFDGPASWE